MKKIVFLLALTLSTVAFASNSTKAEPTPSPAVATQLAGVVIDKKTNEPLAGALILVNDQKIYTDFDGKFKVNNLNIAEPTLKITMISYFEEKVVVDLSKKNDIKVELNQR